MSIQIPEIMLEKIRKLLKDITTLFDDNNVHYWLDGGSMLGCIREGGQIKHDDDADLGVLHKDMKKVVKLIPKIKELGYECGFFKNIFKIFYQHKDALRCRIGDTCINYATLDVFEYTEKAGMIVLKNPIHRILWPDAKHRESDLFPLQKMKFDDMSLWMPNNPFPYLDGLYGDWKTPKHTLKTSYSDFS